MNMIDIIVKKKNKEILSKEEINFVVTGYVNGEIPDYQMSSLLMAIVINGMEEQEIFDLTEVMINSGEIIDLSSIEGTVVDKHSTGGVGDKTTLVLAPLVASLGVKVAKMSGRGLGHTGGTIDKLESIKGYRINLSDEEFIKQVNEIGVSVIGSSKNIAPADKKIYALRDVTGTTESIPLIASSIMSKKIASGADVIVIDVKVGNGALMKNENDARKLADIMIKIGKNFNKKVVCVLTNMEEPLGQTIGNGLEVIESIETLKNNGPEDLKNLVLILGTIMVEEGLNISHEEAFNRVKNNLENNKGYEKFKQMIEYQGGNIGEIASAKQVISIKSSIDGIINHIDTYRLGELAKNLKAGRTTLEDEIDYGTGFVLNKKVGDLVLFNEELLKVYTNGEDIKIDDLINCFDIKDIMPKKQKLIIDIIR